MKMISIIIVTLALTTSATAQLIFDSVRIPVASGTVCPVNWTSQSETIVVEAKFYIRAPVVLGARVFLVSENLVNRLWSTDAAQAAAVVSGILEIQAQSASVQNYCSLLPPSP